MITLMTLDALAPMHLRYGWRGRKNLVTGIARSARTRFSSRRHSASTISDRRSCAHGAHTVLGLAIPVLLVAHVWWGKRTRSDACPAENWSISARIVFSQRVAWLQKGAIATGGISYSVVEYRSIATEYNLGCNSQQALHERLIPLTQVGLYVVC
jgi:hypothetical protein